MDKIEILRTKDRDLLHDFSRRSIERITGHSLPSLPFVSTYLEANIQKEADKDGLIITHTAAIFAAGKRTSSFDIEEMFAQTKTVDQAFVKKLSLPSIAIHLHYDDIAPIRKERIAFLAKIVEDILEHWGTAQDFSGAVKNAYDGATFRGSIVKLLHLYNEETRMLSSSIKFLHPFNKAMDLFIDTLFETMEEVKETIADSCTHSIFKEVPRT